MSKFTSRNNLKKVSRAAMGGTLIALVSLSVQADLQDSKQTMERMTVIGGAVSKPISEQPSLTHSNVDDMKGDQASLRDLPEVIEPEGVQH